MGSEGKSSLLSFRWSLEVKDDGFVRSLGSRAAAYAMSLTLNAGVGEIAACRLASIDRGLVWVYLMGSE